MDWENRFSLVFVPIQCFSLYSIVNYKSRSNLSILQIALILILFLKTLSFLVIPGDLHYQRLSSLNLATFNITWEKMKQKTNQQRVNVVNHLHGKCRKFFRKTPIYQCFDVGWPKAYINIITV